MIFETRPPEINSALMYSGPGATSMTEAATAWTALATELVETAARIGSTVAALVAVWMGPSAMAMSQACASYTAWLSSTSRLCALSSVQAQAAATAYETAYAATVPPWLVALNRSAFKTLVATNFLGINTPAILENEARYAEYWAQDVAAMVAYQAESAAATQLPPFTPPRPATTGVQPQSVTQARGNAQGVLSASQGFDPNTGWAGLFNLYTEALVSSAPYDMPTNILTLFTNMWLSQSVNAADAAATAASDAATVLAKAPAPMVNVTAAGGQAIRMGGLSAPQSWGTAIDVPPAVKNATPIIPATEGEPGVPGIPGMVPPIGKAGKHERVRYGAPITNIIPRHPSAG